RKLWWPAVTADIGADKSSKTQPATDTLLSVLRRYRPGEYRRWLKDGVRSMRRPAANDLDRMCSTFFNVAGCVPCLGGRRHSHQNVNAERRESPLSCKIHGT